MYRPFLAFLLSCLSSLMLALGLGVYTRYIEPRWVEETHWQLQAEHWQGRPLRLAVISDLHAQSGDGAYLDSIVRRTLEARPDAILLLGDYVNDPSSGNFMDAETLGRHLAPLAQLPCFAVLGNHDYDYGADALRTMLQSFGTKMADGDIHALQTGGDTLYISGMRCLCHFDTPGDVPGAPQEGRPATSLLLTHSPAGARCAPEGTTATLAGHTHGGQVCLPGGVPILRPDRRVEWREMKGAFETAGRPVYVSRGLGTSMIPLRLFCRPELLLVELRGAAR